MSAVWPSEATENNNRKVFALFSAIGILASWMGAGLIENLYLECDTLEMEWVEEKEVEGDCNSLFRALAGIHVWHEQCMDVPIALNHRRSWLS